MAAPLSFDPTSPALAAHTRPSPFVTGYAFVGDRLWLDFVNSDEAQHAQRGQRTAASQRAADRDATAPCPDALVDFESFVRWL